ncbi:hypothetical protein EV361DRAFT_123679 [Lentinula raphanica]|uniref:Uncharacterized protein n=1 Tax=Lentinula raphanica TaxID=153919 RepID=A0AA38P2E7_9AGAR|nr:hypothetical protein F5880DRAFT_1322990 [Lentinula raphanica]KAJ3835068.1 hypothetical protein F5878DRAFT_328855 [Lentinula raphanica]KAJ3972667.1 hypothetical protein EV361DRAFT_123679 [Lentinula raphanica]
MLLSSFACLSSYAFLSSCAFLSSFAIVSSSRSSRTGFCSYSVLCSVSFVALFGFFSCSRPRSRLPVHICVPVLVRICVLVLVPLAHPCSRCRCYSRECGLESRLNSFIILLCSISSCYHSLLPVCSCCKVRR